MTDIEKRAHDITVALLPKLMEIDEMKFYGKHNQTDELFNSFDIIDLYDTVYEALLKDLRDRGGYE